MVTQQGFSNKSKIFWMIDSLHTARLIHVTTPAYSVISLPVSIQALPEGNKAIYTNGHHPCMNCSFSFGPHTYISF